MAGAQGIDLRAPLKTSECLTKAISTIRTHCPSLTDDRMVSTDIIKLAALIHQTDELSNLGDDSLALDISA